MYSCVGAGPGLLTRRPISTSAPDGTVFRQAYSKTHPDPVESRIIFFKKVHNHSRLCTAHRVGAQNHGHDASKINLQRRDILHAVPALLCAGACTQPAASSPMAYVALSSPLQNFWNDCVRTIQSGVGGSIDVNLIVWSPKTTLPFGSPGDPASDFTTGGLFSAFNGGCGVRQKDSYRPYQGCPAPGLPASTDLLSECCRHYAYCVPYTPRSTLPLNSITTVVVSERINAASEAVAKGILAHELGHSIDFHCFGARYKLTDHAPDGLWVDSLAALNVQESNFEIRADKFAGLILGALNAGRLCYATDTRTQTVVQEGQRCTGTATRQSPVPGPFAEHYLHSAPVSGLLGL